MVKFKDKFVLDLKRITREQEANFVKESETYIKDMINDAKINLILKGHNHTRKLIEGFYYNKISDTSYIIGNEMFYAGILEKGAPAHWIDAKDKPLLVFETNSYQAWNNLVTRPFIGRDGGFLKVTTSVYHPGVDAEWFLKNAIEGNFKKIKKIYS